MITSILRFFGFGRDIKDDAACIKKEAEDSLKLHTRIKELAEEIVGIEQSLEEDNLEFIRRSGKSLRNTQSEGLLRQLELRLTKKLNELKILLRESEVEERHMELFIDEIKKFIKQKDNNKRDAA